MFAFARSQKDQAILFFKGWFAVASGVTGRSAAISIAGCWAALQAEKYTNTQISTWRHPTFSNSFIYIWVCVQELDVLRKDRTSKTFCVAEYSNLGL